MARGLIGAAALKLRPADTAYGSLGRVSGRGVKMPRAAVGEASEKGLKAAGPGSLILIDTVSVQTGPERRLRHFDACCPVPKWTVAKAFRRATSGAAASFRNKVLAGMPFPVKAIQTGGGSQFRGGFERACAQKGIFLRELPPERPQISGAVEFRNAAWRYEFHAVCGIPETIGEIQPLIESLARLCNNYRPHGALSIAN